MSKLAYHVAHYKVGQIGAIGRHNWERRGEADWHSNQDIDQSRSRLNVQLIDQGDRLAASIRQDLEDRCTGRITAASNVMSETITYPPENLQEDRDRVVAYFRDVLDWHQQTFGAENVKSAVIHFDETTPHMHTDLIPLTADGRLSSKEVFARAALQHQHTDLAKYLQDRGWDIERGESTANKQVRSLSIPEYKKQAEQDKARLQGEIEMDRMNLTFTRVRLNRLKGEIDDLIKEISERQAELQKVSQDLQNALQGLENAQADQKSLKEQSDLLHRVIQDYRESAYNIYGLTLDEKLEKARLEVDHENRFVDLEKQAAVLERFLAKYPKVCEGWELFKMQERYREIETAKNDKTPG